MNSLIPYIEWLFKIAEEDDLRERRLVRDYREPFKILIGEKGSAKSELGEKGE